MGKIIQFPRQSSEKAEYRYFVFYISYGSTRREGSSEFLLQKKIRSIDQIREIEQILEKRLVSHKVIVQNWKQFE